MKPLLTTVVAICLVLATHAHPENIEEVKELPQSKEPVVEAEESAPQARIERCTTCTSGNLKLNIKSPNEVLAAIQALPGAEVHTQQSFEGCSSDKGCAGIKVKDGRVIERFGNVDAFRAAAASNSGNEFSFHSAGSLPNLFGAGKDTPFWWLNENSPFKNAVANGNFEKFSQSSSSSFSTGGAGSGSLGNGIDLAANPFLNGQFSKLAGGFAGSGGIQGSGSSKPSFQSSSFESSSFGSSSKGDIDLSKNPFLNGGVKLGQDFQAQGGFGSSQTGFGAQSGTFGAGGSQGSAGQSTIGSGFSGSGFSTNKFSSTGYTGSTPTPFTASTPGSNVNLIQNTQKASEFDFTQQQTQQNIDDLFQNTGNVLPQGHNGEELQQTCAGEGYFCVNKAQCNNGVINSNAAGAFQASTKKQYCNTRTEICCRLEVSSLPGAGGLQGSLGVGSANFQGSNAQGSGLFGTSGQSGIRQSGSVGFGVQPSSSGASFGSTTSSFGSTTNFGSSNRGTVQGNTQSTFGAGSIGATTSGTFGSGSTTAGSIGSSFGSNAGSVNRGVIEQGSFGVGSNKFGATGSFGTTSAPFSGSTSRFGVTAGKINTNEIYKSTSQSNFLEADSFSAGSEAEGVYRPGASGTGLKPGVPYLPPVDNTNSGSNVISSTAFPSTSFVSTPRPFTTPRPFSTPGYLPPISSTSAPGYLPPEGEQTINKETRLPFPTPPPTYNEGELILDDNRLPRPTPRPTPRPVPVPGPNDIPAGCAAALKCTPIEYCTAEGVISNTTVVLTRDQDAYRVPLTDCKDLETGRVGKCCRDPYYTDPWPTNQLGRWVPGVFGGNDGKYTPDSRGNPSVLSPQITARPPVTGSVLLNNFRTPKPTIPPYGPNQVTPGFPNTGTPVTQGPFSQKGQFDIRGQGQYSQGGQGQYSQGGRGQYSQGGQGQFGIAGQGQVSQGAQGQFGSGSKFTQTTQSFGQRGQGALVTQGQGQITTQGQGEVVTQGQGQLVTQGQGLLLNKGQGQVVTQGQGQLVTQGQGQLVNQGQGQIVSQGQGQYSQGGRGQFTVGGRGQFEIQGQGQQTQFGQVSGQSQKEFGQAVIPGQGQTVTQGQGLTYNRGQGQAVIQGQGQTVYQEQGVNVNGGQGQAIIQGQGPVPNKGQGQAIIQGQGQRISQGFGKEIRQGQGVSVSQGQGFGVENEYSESVQRVFLQQYNAGGECGVLNGQKPYGNRNDNEVDFAEIPWQAMVLLQTNRSLLCGGVITRPDVVVTSAACVEGLQAKNVMIKGGEWKLGIDDEPLPFQIVQVKHILRHPFYTRGNLRNDAAILVLAENLRLAKNIYPICIPGVQETLDAFYNGVGECIVTGWGKLVLQAHLAGSIMHSINVSLINPGECQAKLSQDYPHLLEQYDEDSCACGQPLNPLNNICKVDIGSALACTTGDGHFVLRGVYSWDSGCQTGNQLAAFYKFDVEWYQWAIGLIESTRFAQFSTSSKVNQNFPGQVKGSQFTGGVKGLEGVNGKGQFGAIGQGQFGQGQFGQGQFGQFGQGFTSGQFGQFSKITEAGESETSGSFGAQGTTSGLDFTSQIKGPISNSFSATYTEKKVFQSEPKIITYTTKPEIVTFTTKPEIFTYTTKPKIVTYTTKPRIITYETSGSGTNPQYIAPGVTYNPSFSQVVGKGHTHNAQCKCLENGKK